MAQVASRGKLASIGRWLVLQAASKAVGLAIGSPLVLGAIMAALAYAQDLPLAYSFVAVIIVVAATSTALNQGRAFLVAYNVAHKFPRAHVEVKYGAMTGDVAGYTTRVFYTNKADVPIEYDVTRSSCHLDGKIAVHDQTARTGAIADPGNTLFHSVGLVPMEPRPNAKLSGVVELTMNYGRTGKAVYERTERLAIMLTTDANGMPATLSVFED